MTFPVIVIGSLMVAVCWGGDWRGKAKQFERSLWAAREINKERIEHEIKIARGEV